MIQTINRLKCSSMVIVVLLAGMYLSSCQETFYPKVSLESTEAVEGDTLLFKASAHMIENELTMALKTANEALKSYPADHRQKAIFQKAVIYAHPGNKNRDFKKANFYIDIVAHESRDENLKAYALFLKGVIREIDTRKDENQKLINKLNGLASDKDQLLSQLKHIKTQKTKIEKQNATLKKRIKTLKLEMEMMEEKDYSNKAPIKEVPLGH